MDILFRNKRLDELDAATCLLDFRFLPGRCHEFKADRQGQLSLDLRGPKRLVFEPAHEPLPEKPGGGLDWGRVTAVRILGIVDTHE